MRKLTRLPEPAILRAKKTEWLQRFRVSGKKRPDSGQYGHHQIRETLRAMSYRKCFYCETKLNRGDLMQARLRALQCFERTLRQLHERRGARPLNDAEKQLIRRFAQPDHPFSLMFRIYLDEIAL